MKLITELTEDIKYIKENIGNGDRYQGNQYAPKFKPPSWRQVRDGAYQRIPLDPDTQRIRRRPNRS